MEKCSDSSRRDHVPLCETTSLCFFLPGVLGIKVKIMLPWDPTGKTGPKKPLPDQVSIVEPKEEILPAGPVSEHKGGKPEQPQVPVSKLNSVTLMRPTTKYCKHS